MDGNIKQSLKSLFSTKKESDTSENAQNASGSGYIIGQDNIEKINPDTQREHETYEMWGTRVCGKVNGVLYGLSAFLQRVYYVLYNEQAQNENLQEQRKQLTNTEIQQQRTKIGCLDKESISLTEKKDLITNEIDSLKEEKTNIDENKKRINKDQIPKLIIGLIIIIPLTVYLFVFYSSTFYSAFFANVESINTLQQSMFNPNAISDAFSAGVTECIFVLCAPIIFLALGFVLHFFSVQKEKSKYVKMAAIVFVTLCFDCILAYKIGEQLYILLSYIISVH